MIKLLIIGLRYENAVLISENLVILYIRPCTYCLSVDFPKQWFCQCCSSDIQFFTWFNLNTVVYKKMSVFLDDIHVEELLRGRLRVLAFRLLPAFNLKRIPDFVFPDDHFLEYFFEFIYVFFVGG